MKKLDITPPKLDSKDAAAINRNLAKQSPAYVKAIKKEAQGTAAAPTFGKGKEKRPYTGK